MEEYQIILADPPWKYNARKHKSKFGLGVHGHYPTMDLKKIKEYLNPELLNDNCALFLWVTFPRLKEGIEVLESWGFRYVTIGFNWVKTNIHNDKPFFGIGYYTKSNTEVCLLGIRGKMKPISNKVSSVVISPRREHSRKPDCVKQRITELFGDLPRVELFSREFTDGWCQRGNEINKYNKKGKH